jgi:hypothetical protein
MADDIASSQPRMGRQGVARRVNAGNGGPHRKFPAPNGAAGCSRRVNAGNTGQDQQTTIINADGDTAVNQYNSAGQGGFAVSDLGFGFYTLSGGR